jgi:hypothetical protein
MNNFLTEAELRDRNRKIIADFAKKPETETKTAFAKAYGISTRTLGRILTNPFKKAVPKIKAKPLSKIVAPEVVAKVLETKKELPNVVVGVEKSTNEMSVTKEPEFTVKPEVSSEQIISWTVTKDRFISVMLDNGEPLSVESDHPDYKEIIINLATGDYEEALIKMSVKHLIASIKLGGFEVSNQTILFNGSRVSHSIVDDILVMFAREEPIEHMLRFFENLMANPSEHMYEHLWKLIKHAGVTITPEGNVECFKLVTHDFLDVYTKTIPNNIGDTVTMRRTEVDADFNRTCSHGLHVCARQYISSSNYGGGTTSNLLVKVLVKPQDFVAIPPDYKFTKARVCSYKVLSVAK